MTASSWQTRLAEVRALVLDVDGVLTDGRLHYDRNGEALKSYDTRDGLGLVLLREHGLRLAIVSGRPSEQVRARAKELQIDPCLLGRHNKAEALEELLDGWQLDAGQVCAIGDDIIDLPLLRRVAVSFAPADADARVASVVDVSLRACGGRGAVREAAELILRYRGHWPAVAQRFALPETDDV